MRRPPFPTAWPGEGCAAHLAETERARAQKALLERPPGGWPRVGLCLIIRNAEEYLAEWAAHHRAFGVDRVIVFDDESEDDPRGILETHIAEGFVKVWDRSRPRITRTSGTIELQQNFYRECLRAFLEEGEVSWVGLTDVDEFLTAKEWAPGDTLPSLLHQQAPLPSAAAGGLGVGAAAKRGLGGGPLCVEVGRATYGASFRLQRPPGLATEAYLLRTGKPYTSLTNKLPKILVNLEYADREKLGRFVGAILIHNSMAHGMEKCAGWGKSPLRLNHYLGTAASWALKVATHRTGTGKFLGGFQSFFPKDYEDEADGNALPYLCAAKREMARARGGRRPPGPPGVRPARA
uniref:Glycosyltransferase family 92 protein n=1 Tax=Heterosigma akashiwo TaxID=2829 RepID=A0A7S3Y1Z5_HETAK